MLLEREKQEYINLATQPARRRKMEAEISHKKRPVRWGSHAKKLANVNTREESTVSVQVIARHSWSPPFPWFTVCFAPPLRHLSHLKTSRSNRCPECTVSGYRSQVILGQAGAQRKQTGVLLFIHTQQGMLCPFNSAFLSGDSFRGFPFPCGRRAGRWGVVSVTRFRGQRFIKRWPGESDAQRDVKRKINNLWKSFWQLELSTTSNLAINV